MLLKNSKLISYFISGEVEPNINKSTNNDQNEKQSAFQSNKQKSEKSIVDKIDNEQSSSKNKIENNEIRRPIVSSMQNDKQSNNRNDIQVNKLNLNKKTDETKSTFQKSAIQRPTTASRPLTARAAPPRAVSRRLLKEETNTLEQANLIRPQTSVKQILVTNLIKESNNTELDDLDTLSDEEKLDNQVQSSKENSILKDNLNKLDEQNNDFLKNSNNLNEEIEDPEKGSLVKKLMKSKMDLEGDVEEAKVSNFLRNNRDIDRLKEHIQALTKLANPLSKILDNLQEDIDLMLLEDRNWIEDRQRNEQKLLILREKMNEEFNDLNSQIMNLDEQILQEKESIIVTNVNLLINQAKLKDIVIRIVEN